MVEYRGLDKVFRALGSEPRRRILRRAARKECSVGELAAEFDMTLAGVSKHIQVLANAKLLSLSRDGRVHWCQLNPKTLDSASASIDELRGFWTARMDALESFLVAGASKTKKKHK